MTFGIGTIAVAALTGAAVGALYLSLLRVGARALAGPHPVRTFIALAVLRGALLIGALAGLAALGADAAMFLGALAGFIAARVVATRLVQARVGRVAKWR